MSEASRQRFRLAPETRGRLIDYGIACGLFAGYLLILLLTARNLGYARDEGFYFEAASSYGKWFDLLIQDPSLAVKQASVDRYWVVNHEHPALIKSLFWWSRKLLYGLPLLTEQGTSYRFPGMVLSALAVSVIYLWGAELIGRRLGRLAGLVAALSFAFLPRIFYHAHLACFDMPVTAMWLFTTYAYWKSTQRSSWRWMIVTAILYGLLLNTKHNAWLLPFALFAHFVLDRLLKFGAVHAGRLRFPTSWLFVAGLSPLVFYGGWPWIWFDTVRRFQAYVKFHTGHVYYNMEFLGETYFRAPMPRLYAWVMTLGTVPTITILLFLIGLLVLWRRGLWPALVVRARQLFRRPQNPPDVTEEPASTRAVADSGVVHAGAHSTQLLWLLCMLISYAPWVFPKTPIFGGTKHWITAYPFLCLFAAVGFAAICRHVAARLNNRSLAALYATSSAALVVLVPIVMGVHAHPWALSAYTPLVGGAPGAATLGLNRSFWGYTTGSVEDFLNDAPKNARVFVHDTAMQSWQMFERDGRLRKDLVPWGSVHGSQIALYHHEQHMSRVEFMTWVDYGTVAPAKVGDFDGVPVVWVYARPKKQAASKDTGDDQPPM